MVINYYKEVVRHITGDKEYEEWTKEYSFGHLIIRYRKESEVLVLKYIQHEKNLCRQWNSALERKFPEYDNLLYLKEFKWVYVEKIEYAEIKAILINEW